jgi:flagellar protein FlbD
MISLARFHSGERIAINPDLIERIEETPDTVISLTNGTRYLVEESIDEITQLIRAYRAGLFNLAMQMSENTDTARTARLRVVPGGSADLDRDDRGVRS